MDLRENAKQSVKQFKTNWVELAENLSKIGHNKLFEEWGYTSVEDYCVKELHLKRPTVQKLLNSYYFLRETEPKILENRHEEPHFPQPDLVQVLEKAHLNANIAPENYQSFKESLLESGVNKTTAMKSLKLLDDTPPSEDQRLKQVLGMIRRVGSFFDELDDTPSEYFDTLSQMENYLLKKQP